MKISLAPVHAFDDVSDVRKPPAKTAASDGHRAQALFGRILDAETRSQIPPGFVPLTQADLDAELKKDRDDGHDRPRRGRPRKHGPREANGQASRRKADNLGDADQYSKEPDDLWTATVLGTDLFRLHLRSMPIPNPLFLNLARRCVLDIHVFQIAILWWSGGFPINGKDLLRNALSIKAEIGFEPESERINRKNDGREIVRKKLGDDFVKRMDDAIFCDKIADVAGFIKDLIAVRDVWRAEEAGDHQDIRATYEELRSFYRSQGLKFTMKGCYGAPSPRQRKVRPYFARSQSKV
jgi:hypothetical protein